MAEESWIWRQVNKLASVLQIVSATETWKWIVSLIPSGALGWLSWIWHSSLPVVIALALVAYAATLTVLNHLHLRRSMRATSLSDPAVSDRSLPLAQAQELAAPYIRGKRISIVDLTTPTDFTVRNKTFEQCDIFGPAVIGLQDSSASGCMFSAPYSNVENILIEVSANRHVTGVVGFDDCTFRDCRFFGISIIGVKDLITKIRTVLLAGTEARRRAGSGR